MTPITRPRDVQVLPIALETMILRSRTWDRLKFEIEYSRQKGTTANAYLIQAEQTALIDPPGETFTEIFLQELEQRLDLQQLDYLILGHVNPNRAVTLKALLERAPHLTLVCSNPGAIALKSALPDHPLRLKMIRGEETLNLGQGHELEFILTPTPRWPDRVCTYDRKTQILFTDKLFGAHLCGDQIFDEGWPTLVEDQHYYFDCLMAPTARQVETAVEKLRGWPASFYAPGHGPLIRDGLEPLIQSYLEWCQTQKSQEDRVALLYASAYGNTATLAQAIARGLTQAGVGVESINCEIADPEEIRLGIEKSAGFIIGSPTLGGHVPTPIQTALGIILSTATQVKLAGVFGSYGWSGEAIDLIEAKLRDAGYCFAFEPIRVKFKPTAAILQECEQAGVTFAQTLKKTKKVREARPQGISRDTPVLGDSQVARTEQAVGRIVGSICIITTNQGPQRWAALTSWVSQATFKPPGLTLALSKDQPLAELLLPDHPFVLNILPEGGHLGLIKQFLKATEAAEDPLAMVATAPASNGCCFLPEALSYLECRIQNRMECGDHWLIYAIVENGHLLQANALAAIQHRKSGSYY